MGRSAYRSSSSFALAVVVLAALLCSGCSGRGTHSPTLSQGQTGLPPNPGQSFAGLPAPPQDAYVDPAVLRARRSSVVEQIPRLGDEIYAKSADATADAQNHLLWLDPGVKTAGWGMYEFADLTYGDLPLDITVQLQAPRPEKLYIGYSDYERGSWRWQVVNAPLAVSNVSVPGNLKTISNGGKFYVVVATYDQSPAQLALVQLQLDALAPAPQDFQASDGASGSTIQLSWTPLETSYPGLDYNYVRLERAYIASGPWTQIAELTPGTAQYADVHTGAANNLPYNAPVYYRARTVVTMLDGHPCPVDSGRRLLADVQHLQASDGSDPLAVKLAWDSVPGAGMYNIEYRCTTGGTPLDWTSLTQVLTPATTFDHSGAAPVGQVAVEGEIYAYRLQAQYLADFSLNWSAEETGFRNAVPYAAASVDPVSGNPPLSVELDASSSYDPGGGGITGYEWDFDGDGTYDSPRTSSPTITHVYTRQGEFQPVVRVTDDENEQSTGSTALTVGGWVHTWGGSGGDVFYGVVCDSEGNTYYAGATTGFGAGQSDVLLVKFDAGGAFVWARTWGLAGQDVARGIAVLGDSVYLVGSTDSRGAGNSDVLLLQYLMYNGQFWHAATWDGGADDYGYAIVPVGETLYLSGDTTSNAGHGRDALYIRQGPGGVEFWSAWGGAGNESVRGMAVDNFGHVLLAGSTDSGGQGLQDVLLVEFNTNDTFWWARTWGGPQNDEARCVSTNNSDWLVAGSTSSYGAGGTDALLLWLTAGGGVRWKYSWGGTGDDVASAVVFSSGGHVYLAGAVQETSASTLDLLLLRFSALGSFSWAKSYGSAGVEQAAHCMLSLPGNQLVYGGLAPDVHGDWALSGTSAVAAAGTIAPIVLTQHEFTNNFTTLTGTEGTPGGTLDTGGGGDDGLALTYDTQQSD